MRRKILFYFFLIFLFLILQTTLLKYIRIHGVMPNIIIAFIIVTAFVRNSMEGAAVGLFSGLCLDMLSGGILGFYALLCFILGIAAGSINKRIFRENLMIAVFFTFVYSVAYETVIFVINNIMAGDMPLIFALTNIILPEALYNSVAAILLYPLILKAGKWFDASVAVSRKY